jgi:membrane-associated protein
MNEALLHIFQWILTFGLAHRYLVYAMITFLACAEGPWLSLILGVFLRLGDFSFFPVYMCLMLGDLIGDVGWYCMGRRYGNRFVAKYGKYFRVTASGVERMTRLFHRYKNSVLFLSKVSNGFGLAIVTLMTAGMVRIPFDRFIVVNLLGQFIWTGLLLGIGYFFSHLFITVNSVLGRMSLVATVVVLATMGYMFWKYLRDHVEQFGS